MQGDFEAARSYQERALLLAREIANLYMETYILINLSAVTGLINEVQTSSAHAQHALHLSRQTGDRSAEAWSLLYLGYARLLLGDLQPAEDAFRRSIVIREELGQPGMRMESLAGLIQVLLLKSDDAAALWETENVIAYLEAGNLLDGAEAPLRVYYACYLALEKIRDPRSGNMLQSAVEMLEAQVSRLRDDESRQMFVENVPWRRALWQTGRERSA
jgi:tetratricopeptide (TPR) repeat protein